MSERLPPRIVLGDIPYHSQWESPDLVDKILAGQITAREDPRWNESGAISPEEYEFWSWNTCGMSCFRSVIEYIHGLDVPTISLAKRCAQYGGYKISQTDIDGLYYQPAVDFLATEFGIGARVAAPLSMPDIMGEVSKRNLVIASVHRDIRNPESVPPRKGGHLVLVTGYDLTENDGLLFLHDPAGRYLISQQYARIALTDFSKFFAERGIIIENPAKN